MVISLPPSSVGEVDRVIRILQQLMVDLKISKRGVIDPSPLVTALKV